MTILSLLLGFLLGAAALLFALQNTEVVALRFLGWQFESSLALLVLAALTTGVLISILASVPSFIGSSLRIMSLKKENRQLAQEVERQREANVVVIDEGTNPVLDIRS
jgi:lipopolysaccharide assembly protein A